MVRQGMVTQMGVGFGMVLGLLLGGCQTTPVTAGHNVAQTGAAAQCERAQNQRQGCEDMVGCVWSYNEGTCVVQQ